MTQARLNIALCKLNQKAYDVAIDQCERVLETEPRNWKACFRLASAMYQATDKCTKEGSEKDIRAVYNYAQKALDASPNDAKLKDFRNEVKAKFDDYKAKQQAEEEPVTKATEESKTEKEAGEEPRSEGQAKGLKRVRVTDPEEAGRPAAKKEPK